MDEEAQKKNTDCVYFLASPLTCKKGNNCEYRHSEAVRMNPRDCWFWLNATCLNANCSFRHPPLDGRPSSTSTPLPPDSAPSASTSGAATAAPAATAAASKSKTPCFYFTQGYCSKGDKCLFMHGLPGTELTAQQKPPKAPFVKGADVDNKPGSMTQKSSSSYKYTLQGPASASASRPVTAPEAHSMLSNVAASQQQVSQTANARNFESSLMSSNHNIEDGKIRKGQSSNNRTGAVQDSGNVSKQVNGGRKIQQQTESATERPWKAQVTEARMRNGLIEDSQRNGYRSDGWRKEVSPGFAEGSDQSVFKDEDEFSSHPDPSRYPNRRQNQGQMQHPTNSLYEPSRDYGQSDYQQGVYERGIRRGDHEHHGSKERVERQQSLLQKGRISTRDRQGPVAEGEFPNKSGDLRDHLLKRRKNERVQQPTGTESHSRSQVYPDGGAAVRNSVGGSLDHRSSIEDTKGVKRSHTAAGFSQERSSTKKSFLKSSSNRLTNPEGKGGESGSGSLAKKSETAGEPSSTFAGPKSLAQIKAEKRAVEGIPKSQTQISLHAKHADENSVITHKSQQVPAPIPKHNRLQEGFSSVIQKDHIHGRLNFDTTKAEDFEGPKSLSLILKGKRKTDATEDEQKRTEEASKSSSDAYLESDGGSLSGAVSAAELSKEVEEGEVLPDSLAEVDISDATANQEEQKDEGIHGDHLYEVPIQEEQTARPDLSNEEQGTPEDEEMMAYSDDTREVSAEGGDAAFAEEYEFDDDDDDDNDFAKKLGGLFS